jgi:hypothetical protein
MAQDGPEPTFTLFPNLLKELRTKIWRYALPGPCIIQVQDSNGSFFFNGARPPPLALYTCQASREVALSVFELAFARNKLPPIYIDLDHDTLHLAIEPRMFADAASFVATTWFLHTTWFLNTAWFLRTYSLLRIDFADTIWAFHREPRYLVNNGVPAHPKVPMKIGHLLNLRHLCIPGELSTTVVNCC